MSDQNQPWDKVSELPNSNPQPPMDSTDERVNFILSSFAQFSTIANGLATSQQQLYDMLNSFAARVPAASAGAAPAIRFREPPVFKGKPKELDGFLFAIQDGIDLQRHAFTSDTERVTYMVGYLGEGSPRAWLTGVRKHSSALLADYSAFVAAFKAHFSDPDFLGTATRHLAVLRQTGACSIYAARFRELAAVLDLTEFSRCEYFYNGLKEEVKDGIVYSGRPTMLDELKKLALAIDNQIYTRSLERTRFSGQCNGVHPPSQSTASPSSTTPTIPPPVSTPMEVDAIRDGPLTPAERQHRRDQNLCMYCGGPGHQADACTKLPDSRRRAKPPTVASIQENVQSEVP